MFASAHRPGGIRMSGVVSRVTDYTTNMTKGDVERRIYTLHRRARRIKDGFERAELRAEVDALLEEFHRRWPNPET
jgi:hypothetical protein